MEWNVNSDKMKMSGDQPVLSCRLFVAAVLIGFRQYRVPYEIISVSFLIHCAIEAALTENAFVLFLKT